MKRSSTEISPSNKRFSRLNSIENSSSLFVKTSKSNGIQTDPIEQDSKATNTPNYFDEMLIEGDKMNDEQFETFLRERAADCVWKILAERARIKLDDQLRENQQLHQLLNQLTKENEQLREKNEHCEYLNNVFHSITSEYDSGIELHVNVESPV